VTVRGALAIARYIAYSTDTWQPRPPARHQTELCLGVGGQRQAARRLNAQQFGPTERKI
jgi:hypothetical protein